MATTSADAVAAAVAYWDPNHILSSAGRLGRVTDEACQYSVQNLAESALIISGVISSARDTADSFGSTLLRRRLSCTAVMTKMVVPACNCTVEVAVDMASSLEITGECTRLVLTMRFAMAVHGEKNDVLGVL